MEIPRPEEGDVDIGMLTGDLDLVWNEYLSSLLGTGTFQACWVCLSNLGETDVMHALMY